ncbi:hypothetical protein [Desulfosporosinus sp.]|nr:hypothetical protein [Desulfosporosinus sp.]
MRSLSGGLALAQFSIITSVVWFLRSEVSFRDKLAFDEISPLAEE